MLSCFYKETLPASERIALSIRGSNPFSFGKLLTHGRRLRQFALMEVLNNFGSMRAIWQTTDTLRMEMLGWGPPERARMMSMTGVCGLLSKVDRLFCQDRLGTSTRKNQTETVGGGLHAQAFLRYLVGWVCGRQSNALVYSARSCWGCCSGSLRM